MANEYRATLVGTEVLDDGTVGERTTLVGAEVSQVDDDATQARATLVGSEIHQVDDNATDLKVTFVGLEVLRTINDADPGTNHFLTFDFGADATLIVGAFDTAKGLTFAFRSRLRLGLTTKKFPLFACDGPEPKAWARLRPQAKAWGCAVVTPAEECTGEDAANDDLDLVSGDRLVTLDGYGLKLVS